MKFCRTIFFLLVDQCLSKVNLEQGWSSLPATAEPQSDPLTGVSSSQSQQITQLQTRDRHKYPADCVLINVDLYQLKYVMTVLTDLLWTLELVVN